jgi:hypothetical protein
MIAFHRFLIGTAVCFCLGFAAWAFTAYRSGGGMRDLAFAVSFACIGVLLGYYLKNLNRFLHR